MEIQCPTCQGSLEAGPEWAGQVIACPHCGSQLTVPAAPPVAQAHLAAQPPPKINPALKYQKKKMSGLTITLIVAGCLVAAAIAFMVLVVAPHGRAKARSLQLQQAEESRALLQDHVTVGGLVAV